MSQHIHYCKAEKVNLGSCMVAYLVATQLCTNWYIYLCYFCTEEFFYFRKYNVGL